MSASTSDLGRLKWAIALLAVLSAAGSAAVWYALQEQKAGEKALKATTLARNDIRSKLSRAREEQAELLTKIARFEALRQRGYVGEEQRLDWVEALAKIKSSRRIQRMEYDFSPQRAIDAAILPGGASAGSYTLVASTMRLKVETLHEGEVLAVIDDIRKDVTALIQIRACEMQRIVRAPSDRSNPAQIKAECTMEWITVKERQK